LTNTQTTCLGPLAHAAVACGSHAPVKIAAGDQRFRCRRYIGNELVPGETIDSKPFVSRAR